MERPTQRRSWARSPGSRPVGCSTSAAARARAPSGWRAAHERRIELPGSDGVIRTYFSYANPAGIADDLAALVRLMQTGQLTVRLGAHLPWSAINAVLDDFAAGLIDGKAVVDTD